MTLLARDEEVRGKNQPGSWELTFVVFGFSTSVVFARLASRLHSRHFGIDDALICVSWMCNTLCTFVYFARMRVLEPVDVPSVGIHCMFLVYNIAFVLGMPLVKVSGLVFLYRISRTVFARTATWFIYGGIIWTLLGATQLVVLQLIGCKPLSALEKCWKGVTECIDRHRPVLAFALNLLAVDILLIILPIIFIMRLQMMPKKKYIMYSIPALATIDTIIMLIRTLIYAKETFPSLRIHLATGYEFGFDSALVPIEMSFALMTASLPMLYRPIKSTYRYIKAVCKSRSFAPGKIAGNIDHTGRFSRANPLVGRRTLVVSNGHVDLSQLTTIVQDDSLSIERTHSKSKTSYHIARERAIEKQVHDRKDT